MCLLGYLHSGVQPFGIEPFCSYGGLFPSKVVDFNGHVAKFHVSELTRGSNGSVRSGAASAPLDLPSPRARGQDDVSSQANSLKIIRPPSPTALVRSLYHGLVARYCP